MTMTSYRNPDRETITVNDGDLPATARVLASHLADMGSIFQRAGTSVELCNVAGALQATPLEVHRVVMLAHDVCRPVRKTTDGELQEVTLPDRVAKMWLSLPEKNLRQLAGITTAPLLSEHGAIRTEGGYDGASGLFSVGTPSLDVADRPTRADAEAALRSLRIQLCTFAFQDAVAPTVTSNHTIYTDLQAPPGLDESSAIAALLTSCCRQSLGTAPGFMVTAPHLSGSGSGKGLLVRLICQIAFGIPPSAITRGDSQRELDQRIASELMAGASVVFVDNVNSHVLKSEILAQILTEPHVRSRRLGGNSMVPIRNTAFVTVTGNAVRLGEDLSRRFIQCGLDPRCEHPERREFPEILSYAVHERAALLSSVLTIWRWGRQNDDALPRGSTLGSFEQWARWCRDPLLALGCRDPIDRMQAVKSNDPVRAELSALFEAWHAAHGDTPQKFSDLSPPVQTLLHPSVRQSRVARLNQLVGARWNGFVLTHHGAVGRWGAATYRLLPTET